LLWHTNERKTLSKKLSTSESVDKRGQVAIHGGRRRNLRFCRGKGIHDQVKDAFLLFCFVCFGCNYFVLANCFPIINLVFYDQILFVLKCIF
jgi:hypothetical protein